MEGRMGLTVKRAGKDGARIVRLTTESRIEVSIEVGRLNELSRAYLQDLRTGLPFFDHMLYGAASRAMIKLNASFGQTESKAPVFAHVVCEDVGLTLGACVREVLEERLEDGVEQRGFFQVAFDDGLACATLAFDGRPYCYFLPSRGTMQPQVEGIESSSIKQFFDGFAIGAGCNVVIENKNPGDGWQDGHHAWEAAFKAFGEALRQSLDYRKERAGSYLGLKGTGVETKC